MSLYETEDYIVNITNEHKEVPFPKDKFQGYGIFNKKTNVMENSSTILAEAIRWAKQLQTLLDEQMSTTTEENAIKWPSKLN